MKGLALGALVLVGLDLLLTSPSARVSAVLGRPSHWLAAWMDASTPLIPVGHLNTASGSSASTSSSSGSGSGGVAVPDPLNAFLPGAPLPAITVR